MNKSILPFLLVIIAASFHTYVYYNNINSFMNTDPVIHIGQARTLLDYGTTGQLFADPENLSKIVIPPHSAMWPPFYLFLLAAGFYINENPLIILTALQFLICLAYFFFFYKIVNLLRDSLGRFFVLLIYLSWFVLPGIFMPASGQVDFLPAVLLMVATYFWMRQSEDSNGATKFAMVAAVCLGISFWTRYSYWVYLAAPVVLLVLNLFYGKEETKKSFSKSLISCIVISMVFLAGIIVYQKTFAGYYSQLDEGTHNPNTGFYPLNLLKIYLFPLLIYGGDIGVKSITEVNPLLLLEFFILLTCFLIFVVSGWKKLRQTGLNPESIFAIIGILVLSATIFVLGLLTLRYKEEYGDFTYVSLVRYYYPVYIFLVLGILIGIRKIYERQSMLFKSFGIILVVIILARGFQHVMSDTRKFTANHELFLLSNRVPELSAFQKEVSDWKGPVVLLRIDPNAWDEKFYALVYPFVDLVSITQHLGQSLESQGLHTSKPVKIIFVLGDEMRINSHYINWTSKLEGLNPSLFYRNAEKNIGYYSFILRP